MRQAAGWAKAIRAAKTHVGTEWLWATATEETPEAVAAVVREAMQDVQTAKAQRG